jgi:DNA polymerase-3 subunit beta
MRATVERAPLVDDLRLAERLLPIRSPEPLLEHVLLRGDSEGVVLVANDRELALCLRLDARVEEGGTALLPARRVLAFLREAAFDAVEIDANESLLRLRAPGVTCRLRYPDPALFPTPGPLPSRANALLPAEALEGAIRRTLFAAARRPGCYRDYLLDAVLVEVSQRELRLVASDNRRLAVARVPVLLARPDDVRHRVLLSTRAVALLGRLTHEQEEVRASFSEGEAFFRVGRATLAARLLRGRYPDWQAALPTSAPNNVNLPLPPLLAGVKQAAVLREQVHARVRLRLELDRLTIESEQTGLGSVTVEQEVDYAGEEMVVGFNPVHLLELLRALEGTEKVRLELTGPEDAALFIGTDGYQHVLMPLLPTVAPDPVFVPT